jgi:hypothetical protein
MAQNEVLAHIHVTLDSTNYTVWSKSIRSFLKGRKLWLYVTGDIPKPTKVTAESDDAFHTRLIDWDSKHHQILTWFRNTTIPSIAALFGCFDDAQGTWDMLASRYSSIDGSREYQTILDLYRLKQDSDQTIIDFFAHMQFLWDQLALFEPVCGQLLHRSPLPTLDQAVCEVVREETRLSILRSQHTLHTYSVLYVPSPQTEHSEKSDRSSRGPSKNQDNPFCRYCHRYGHTIDKCWRKAKSSTFTTVVGLLLRLLQLLPLATLQDLLSPYLQLTLRQLSTRSSLILVMHLPLSFLF